MEKRKKARPQFRFENLEIWRLAKDLAITFHNVAEDLDKKKLFKYAEQLRAAGLSISNNIAEGSGSIHNKEFNQFLNISRRSLFEDASMLLVFEAMNILNPETATNLLWECDNLSRKITNFMRNIRGKSSQLSALSSQLLALSSQLSALSSQLLALLIITYNQR